MNWGNGIILAFVVFAALVSTMVGVCMNQDVDLVAKDYYKQEIAYQSHINKMTNHKELPDTPSFNKLAGTNQLEVVFPLLLLREMDFGKLVFYRPSDASQDYAVNLIPSSEGKQLVDISSLNKGLWKLQLTWSNGEKEYYNEYTIVL